MLRSGLLFVAFLWAVSGYAFDNYEALDTRVRQIFELNWQSSERCLNDFTVILRAESELNSDGSLMIQKELNQDGELIVKLSPLAKEAFPILQELETAGLKTASSFIRQAYWKEEGQEKHIGFEFVMSFKLNLPTTILDSKYPLARANAEIAEFKTSFELMRALHVVEAKSANFKFMVYKNWGIPVRISCQKELAGVTGSSK